MNLIEHCKKINLLDENQFFDEAGNMYLVLGKAWRNLINKPNAIYDLLYDLTIDKDISLGAYGCIPADLLKEINKVDIQIDEELLEWKSFIRRPYYQIRGKRVTEEQAFDLIRKTDRCFWSNLRTEAKYKITDFLGLNHLYNWIANTDGTFHNSWVHKNGIIGGSGITNKHPGIGGLIYDGYMLASNFPYLDMIAAITSWDEVPRNIRTGNKIESLSLTEFLSEVVIGVHVKDGNMRIIDRAETIKIYKSYTKLYEEKDKRIYEDTTIVKDSEYFERLLKDNGLNHEDLH